MLLWILNYYIFISLNKINPRFFSNFTKLQNVQSSIQILKINSVNLWKFDKHLFLPLQIPSLQIIEAINNFVLMKCEHFRLFTKWYYTKVSFQEPGNAWNVSLDLHWGEEKLYSLKPLREAVDSIKKPTKICKQIRKMHKDYLATKRITNKKILLRWKNKKVLLLSDDTIRRK